MTKPKDVVPLFKGLVKEGKIVFSDPFSVNHWLINLEGKIISIKIRRWAEKRTDAQNRFYWKYLRIVSDELSGGETPPEWYHEYFKRVHLSTELIKLTLMDKDVKNIVIPGSSTELNKYQFSQYLKNIEHDTGVPVPDPKLFGFNEDIYSRKLVPKNA